MSEYHHMGEKLPQQPESYWIKALNLPTFSPLKEDKQVDVVIVGGGITGITAAFLLVNEGLKVSILEADSVLNGTTGHTTAKITAQHGLIYDELIQNTDLATAKLYYEANKEALQFIRDTVEKQSISCDLQKQDAYVYATTDEYSQKIEKEAEAYKALGIDGELSDSIPLDINIQKALVMKNRPVSSVKLSSSPYENHY